MVNSYDSSHNYYTKSVVYQASGGQFIKYQEGSSYLSFDLMSYEYKGDTYLAVANHNNNKHKQCFIQVGLGIGTKDEKRIDQEY